MAGTLNDASVMRRVVESKGRVAMVGLSSNELRESNRVARFLIDRGYDVVPVNPGETEVLGRRCFASLAEIPGRIDCVDVFRRSESVGPVVDEAIARGVPVLWFQLGIVNYPAAAKAQAAGIDVVMDHCMKIETMRQEAAAAGATP